MYCEECGAKCKKEDAFCGECGTAIKKEESHSLKVEKKQTVKEQRREKERFTISKKINS